MPLDRSATWVNKEGVEIQQIEKWFDSETNQTTYKYRSFQLHYNPNQEQLWNVLMFCGEKSPDYIDNLNGTVTNV